jgi:DNA-binding NarL/FixJ family response regulator
MAVPPRIVTLDPSGTIPHLIRAAADLLNRSIILVDMPDPRAALAEIKGGACRLLVTAVELLDEDMKGIELALQARRDAPGTHVIILADEDDPALDDETLADSPFVYLRRPVDAHQFMRVLRAGMDGEDVLDAMQASSAEPAFQVDMGPVPPIDREAARTITDGLLTDVGAMAIIFASREGEVLLERGAVGYIDRERLTRALLPTISTTVEINDLVGGRATTIQYYDGENYDIFVLSVGLHHFLCVVMDGQAGNRQFGAVNRFGRRAAEDLIALMGASAFTLQKPAAPVDAARKGKRKARELVSEPQEVDFTPIERPEIKVKEPEPLQLEPLQELDLSIFDNLDKLDANAADDLFDPDRLAALASESRRRDGPIDADQAQELGIIPRMD